MTGEKPFHKSGKFYIISGIALVIVVAGLLFWRNYKYKFVSKKLDNLVTVKSRGLYEVNYQHLIIDEAGGNISAEDVELIPDSLVYQYLQEQNTAPENLFYIKIPKLHITGVKTPKALLNKEISAHIMRIIDASIEIRMGKAKKENKPDFGEILDPGLYRQLLGKLNSITADSVVLENAVLILTDRETKRIRYKMEGLSLRFASVSIDSATQYDSMRILFSKELTVHCDHFDLPFKDKMYKLTVNDLDYNSRTAILHTNRIKLIPALSETAFANSHKYAKDRFDIGVGSLELKNIDRMAMLNQQILADTLQLKDASFHIFRDKSFPHDSVDRTHDYPQESIMRLGIPVRIKKLLVNDSYIEYKEKNEKSDSSGKVSFFHVQAVLSNVTNIPEFVRLNYMMHLQFNASFLNQTPFTADIQMRLNDRKGNFQLDAQMGALNAVMLNPLTEPMALAKLDKGRINGLRYHMNATNTHAKGRLTLRYDDLTVKLLKKDDNKNKYKTKLFPTLAAGLIIKKSNPQNGETRRVDVDYTRDIHRSIFNLMWKSLYSGIKKTVM